MSSDVAVKIKDRGMTAVLAFVEQPTVPVVPEVEGGRDGDAQRPLPAPSTSPANVQEWSALYSLPWGEASPRPVAPVAAVVRRRRRVDRRCLAEVVAEIAGVAR